MMNMSKDNNKFWQRYAPVYWLFVRSAGKAYDEIAEIVVVDRDENMIPIIRDGRFVLEGTEELNIPLNKK